MPCALLILEGTATGLFSGLGDLGDCECLWHPLPLWTPESVPVSAPTGLQGGVRSPVAVGDVPPLQDVPPPQAQP